ncbi:LPXTG-anchored zinc carboxypeptidase [Streptococcus sp. HMSC078D09]|uniref:LPXTG-anchored zinc carboxypeptidase n=1 Tax=Streptococcus sp. HMSC078D09 TaxID=1739430 RepID=UPI0008A5475F|nr:LPXTG-anchored zinc carboxypeptidase [Streptococcus sp. HMSC078D09]OFQ62788.1 zinc carboxypeptidase [Streptococcus sp. HMSC078D09]
MKSSYKKHLYTTTLSLSAAVLLSVIGHGQASADSVEAPQTEPSTVLEATPATEQPVTAETTSHATATEVTPASPAERAATSDVASSTEVAPTANPSTNRAATTTDQATRLADSTIYLSEKSTIDDKVQEKAQAAGKISWTLDNKPLSEWKTWDMETGTLSKDPFLTITETVNGNDLDLHIDVQDLFGQDLSLRSPNNIRRTYRNYIGNHELVGTNADLGVTINKTLVFRPYQDYHTHEEMLAAIEKSKEEAKPDRLVQLETLGKSAQGRDMKMGIVSKDQASIDHYLSSTNPTALTKPSEMLAALKDKTLDYKLPVLVHNTHADEQPGIDIITGLFRTFATENQVTFKTTDEAGNVKNVTLDIPTLLNKFIFLFDFTENPDGDALNLRALANGLDPNRDASYQTNPEVRTVIQMINKWNPIALYDIHGFVKEFLIEPATPPHDPNFEYDLMSNLMLENAHHMGRAGVANSKYDSYIIPKLDWGDGWDDSFSGYTGVYAVYHGILGHTIEIPESNQESYYAGRNAVLGGIDFLNQDPDKLLEMRLNFYLRGLNKTEDPKAENELVGPNGEIVGRVKNGRPKFFPDYYVIPMGLDKDNDAQEAFNMIDYFKRNGVLVKELKEDTGNYKKGDLVIDMAQAKRGYANHILYKGSNESAWAAMYAELLVNFPDMRGFKSEPVFADGLFNGKLGEVTTTRATRTSEIDPKAPYYVIANTSASAVKAINQAISQGKSVYLTDDGYIVDRDTFASLLPNYAIYGDALYKVPSGPTLKPMKVYSPNYHYNWAGVDAPAHTSLVLEKLGFQIVNTPEEADVVILESNRFDASIFGKKPTLVIGGEAMQKLEKLGVLAGFDAEKLKGGSDYEGSMKAIIDDQDPLTSGYKKNTLFYSNSGNWIEKVPSNFKTLMSIASSDYYIAGWWPKNEVLANKVMAISGELLGQPLFVYAGNPTNRQHPVHFFRWVTNAIFGSKLASLMDYVPAKEPDQVVVSIHNQTTTPQPILTKKETPKVLLPQKEMTTENEESVQALTYQVGQSFQESPAKAQLPQTGEDTAAHFILSGFLLAVSGGFLLLKKKEVE